jgi:hypothetical protein
MKTKRIIVQLRSDVIRSDLARLGRTHGWLAERCGIPRQYLSQLLRWVRNPGPALRQRIHAVLAKHAGRSWREIFREVR